MLAAVLIAEIRSAMSGAIALMVTWYGIGDIAVATASVASFGIAGEIAAMGQTSEMYVHEADAPSMSQRAYLWRPWQPGRQA